TVSTCRRCRVCNELSSSQSPVPTCSHTFRHSFHLEYRRHARSVCPAPPLHKRLATSEGRLMHEGSLQLQPAYKREANGGAHEHRPQERRIWDKSLPMHGLTPQTHPASPIPAMGYDSAVCDTQTKADPTTRRF